MATYNDTYRVTPDSLSTSDITSALQSQMFNLLDRENGVGGKLGYSDERNLTELDLYNWMMTLNEREYNSASALLGRLMATGMSYSAALAALTGSGGSASGSAGSALVSAPVSHSAEFANIANGASAITNAATNTFATFMSLGLNAKAVGANTNLLNKLADMASLLYDITKRMYDGNLEADAFNLAVLETYQSSKMVQYSDVDGSTFYYDREFNPYLGLTWKEFDTLVLSYAKSHPDSAIGKYVSGGNYDRLRGNAYAWNLALRLWKNGRANVDYNTPLNTYRTNRSIYFLWLASKLLPDITLETLNLYHLENILRSVKTAESKGYLEALKEKGIDGTNYVGEPGESLGSIAVLDDGPMEEYYVNLIANDILSAFYKSTELTEIHDYLMEALKTGCLELDYLKNLIKLNNAIVKHLLTMVNNVASSNFDKTTLGGFLGFLKVTGTAGVIGKVLSGLANVATHGLTGMFTPTNGNSQSNPLPSNSYTPSSPAGVDVGDARYFDLDTGTPDYPVGYRLW